MMPSPSPTQWEDLYVSISIPKQPTLRAELEQYIRLNDDLPRETVLQIAPFALYKTIGKQGVDDLFSGIRSSTVRNHYPWFWWQCLTLSNLDHLWFADELNDGKISARTWTRRIAVRTTPEEQALLLKRFYRRKFSLPRHRLKNKETGQRMLWTKGGRWDERLGMTKILVLGEHLERKGYSLWASMLGDEIKVIETELRTVANPDKFIYPEAYKLAVKLEPKLIIPMHYSNETLKVFLKEAGEEGVKGEEKITIKKKDLENNEGNVVVLEPQK